jgi:transcriptional regulator with XRE-family HTH domain
MTTKSIASQIRDARIDSGFTQDELAGHLKVSRQMVGRYESGADEPSISVIARASSILGVSFEVEGIRILCEAVDPQAKLLVVPHQLRFDFGKMKRFQGAIIEITPQKGKLLISAEIPAEWSTAKAK